MAAAIALLLIFGKNEKPGGEKDPAAVAGPEWHGEIPVVSEEAVQAEPEPKDSFPLRDNVKLVFTIQTTHPISNTSKCIGKNYRKTDIKRGTFESGRSTKFILRREG